MKFCIDEIIKVTDSGTSQKLRDVLFSKKTNNAFGAMFTTLVIAFHEVLIGQKQKIASYAGAKSAITKLDTRVDTGRGSTSVVERRKNVDVVKGLLLPHVVESDLKEVYTSHSVADIDATIRRSEIELPAFELKQGMLSLDEKRAVNESLVNKVVQTICAIANNGPGAGGTIVIGVSDKPADTHRIEELDRVSPRTVGPHSVVGVKREAQALGESVEAYFGRWKSAIRESTLSSPLKESVLSALTYHDYFGLGVLVIAVPAQRDVSFVGDAVYMRSGDETREVTDAKTIASVVGRFA